MRVWHHRCSIWIATAFFLRLICATPLFAQTAVSGGLHGQVLDPSGAAVAGATVLITTPSGDTLAVVTNHDGVFDKTGLAPGKYTVEVSANGFALYKNDAVQIAAGAPQKLIFTLAIEAEQQSVVVTAETPTVDVAPESNAGAIVISGKELDALPDDPDELETDLEALAGPSAGPNGGQFYIDGFTAGQLPPKSAIREIRINQNPFSAEYDKVGYGRVEIFTKPGTDKWHGSFSVNANDSAFNSRNPYFTEGTEGSSPYPGYDSVQYIGSLSGPLGKKASLFLTADVRDINNLSIVNAQTVNSQNQIVPFSAAVPNPRTRDNIAPRVDYQVSKNNTLSVRYQYYRDDETNDGIGAFTLPTQAYNLLSTEQTVQVSDTQIFGSKIVNETHFQYLRDETNQDPQSTAFSLIVGGAFNGGGSGLGQVIDNTNHYELQNYTSIQLSKHFLKFGGRLRGVTDSNSSTAGFNGEYIFPSIQVYQSTLEGLTQGATQFLQTTGTPHVSISMVDVGLYFEDDWRLRPNMTLSYGLRFESQNDISNHADWAPRMGFAWGISRHKAPPKTVLRAGFGIFYDRFLSNYVLQAARQNGIIQSQYVFTNPDFFPSTMPVLTPLPTIYQVAPNIHAPYTVQTAVSLERQLTKISNFTATYLNSIGNDQFYLNNVNTPLPGTYDYPYYTSPIPGVRPITNFGNVYEYESGAIFRQNQLILQVNVRAASKLTLFSYYTLNYADSDTSGATSFPSNPFDVHEDYGRASFDIRDRYFLGGNISLPYHFSLAPFMIATSGTPYNITLSQDLIGSAQFNQRPAFASALSNPSDVVTVPGYGSFDTVPQLGEKLVPVNYLTSPGRFTLNLRLSKTFGFGKVAATSTGGGEAGGGGHGSGGGGGRSIGGPFGGGGGGLFGGNTSSWRYNITMSANVRNVFNNVNPATPTAVLNPPTATSPASYSTFFAVPNALAGGPFSTNSANRIIYLQTTFSF
jgi:hypothetical protein